MGKRTKADRKLQIAAFIRQVHENAENAPNIDSKRQHDRRHAAGDESYYNCYSVHESGYGKDIIHESNTVKVNCSTEKGRACARVCARKAVSSPGIIDAYTDSQKAHRQACLSCWKRRREANKARKHGGG